jgi:hypothetical protein
VPSPSPPSPPPLSFRLATSGDANAVHACGVAWLPDFLSADKLTSYMSAPDTQRIIVATAAAADDAIVGYAACTLYPDEEPVRAHIFSLGSYTDAAADADADALPIDVALLTHIKRVAYDDWGARLLTCRNHVESGESIAQCRSVGFIVVEESPAWYTYTVVANSTTQNSFKMQVVLSAESESEPEPEPSLTTRS